MAGREEVETDVALLEKWRGGDRGAGAALFDRHYQAVTRFFRSKVSIPPEDLVQKTFLGLTEATDRFRGEGSFRSFVFSIAYNVLRNYYRSRSRKPDIDLGSSSIEDLGQRMSQVLEAEAERRALVAALRKIPVESQTLLELYYQEDLSGPEIARVLGLPVGTVRTRIRRAKELLAQRLEQITAQPGLVHRTLSLLDG